jgi:hypothetical protein
MVLSPEGVQSGDELLAYARVPEGRKLTGSLAQDFGGHGQPMRVRAFGPPSSDDVVYPIVEFFSETVPVAAAAKGALSFLVLPGLVVLAVGLGTTISARDKRLESTCRETTTGWKIAVAALETLLLAAPGVVGATIFWGAISPQLEWVPLVGHDVLQGDLWLTWWLLLAAASACVVAIGLVGGAMTAVITLRCHIGTARTRSMSVGRSRLPLQTAPWTVALAVALFGWFVLGPLWGILYFVATVATLVGVFFVLTVLLPAVVNKLDWPLPESMRIASRDLERHPVRAAWPFLTGAALVVLAPIAGGHIALARDVDASTQPSGQTHAIIVDWIDPRPDDLDRFAKALGSGLVVPFSDGENAVDEHDDGHTHEEALTVAATCQQLAPYFPGTSCGLSGPHDVPGGTQQSLIETVGPHFPNSATSVRLAPASEIAAGPALVIDDAPFETLNEHVRVVAMRELAAPSVYTPPSGEEGASPLLLVWMTSCIVAPLVILTVAFVLSLGNHLLGTLGYHPRLPSLGPSPSRQDAWRFAIPYSATVVLGLSAGLAICALMVTPDVAMPWGGVGVTVGVASVIGLVGTASAMLLGKHGRS